MNAPHAPQTAPPAFPVHHLQPLAYKNRALLIEQNRALVPFALAPLLRQYPNLSDADRDDVTARGLRALVEAADKYDPNAGVKFSTYAVALIQFAGRKALAKCGDWKAKRAGFAVASLDEAATATEGAAARVDSVADDRSGDAFALVLDIVASERGGGMLWDWIRDTVTPRQFKALHLCYAGGMTTEDAAALLGISHQGVSGRIQKDLERLRKAANTPSGKRAVAGILDGEL